MIELAGVALYAAILWLATAYFARGYSDTKEGFLAANRNIGLFAGALSIGATAFAVFEPRENALEFKSISSSFATGTYICMSSKFSGVEATITFLQPFDK